MTEAETAGSDRGTFVLIHGAWHGGWIWSRLSPRLRALGHEVYAPSLTGLGERAHLLTPDVGLETHVEDILALLEFEDLRDVVLVGHSFAGTLITIAAERMRWRLRHLVYLDAGVPNSGESVLSRAIDVLRFHIEDGVKRGDGWRVPPPPVELFGIDDPSDAEWVRVRLRDMPYRSFTDRAVLTGQGGDDLLKTFIQTTGYLDLAAERAKDRGFQYVPFMQGGHDAMFTRPREMSDVLHNAFLTV